MIGKKLAHFEITDKLGAGGMGEVYRAQDTKLGREVALKVLPEAFAQDHERMGRFAREAQVLASLNHTNIAAIYSLESATAVVGEPLAGSREGASPSPTTAAGPPEDVPATVNFLVMELVEGETLQQRIARGALSLEETARVGLEMARAMEVAHEKGIVHRDLKPANVKITPDGQVKVLDFGLAKALEEEPDPANIANSPTLTAAATQAGIILGTAAYMSPEQAAGSVADRRADVWSYGVVLTEMLTGHQQFSGETVSHTLASVLKDEPEWDRFPKHVPPRILDLLRRCLRKDAKKRLQAIGEARVIWEEYLADPESFATPAETVAVGGEPIPTWKRVLPWAVAGLMAIALGVTAWQYARVASRPQPLLRATILPPEGYDWYLESTFPGRVAISPDGRQLAFSAIEEGGAEPVLWIQSLDSPVGRPLQNTDGASYPFWSPDGRHVAFYTEGKLKKIAVAGGPPVSLCDAPFGKSGSWNRQGTIVFPPNSNSGLLKVAAAGGDCVPITELDVEAGENSHRHPWFLPDGNRFLYLARRAGVTGTGNMVRIGSLDGTTDFDLIASPSNAAFASGRLLFVREGTLMSQPFDADRLELGGEAVPLVEDILEIGGAALSVFSVSETGVLVYQTGRATETSQLVWRNRSGAETGTLGDPANQTQLTVSEDGSSVVATMVAEDEQSDLWIYDSNRGLRTRFTFSPGDDVIGVWNSNRERIAFASDRETGQFDLYVKEVGGTGDAQLLLKSANMKIPRSWTPDDQMILYTEWVPGEEGDLWALPIEVDAEPIRLTESEFGEHEPSVSPDGRWLLYSSNESGRREVYVTTFPRAERKWQVSVEGGRQPSWTKDGTEIVFLSATFDGLYAVEVSSTGNTVEIGAIEKLFDVELRGDLGQDWDVTADGERFLINSAPERGRISAVHLAVNWPAILEEQ